MSIMDSHPHSSLGRGNAAGPAFFDNPATTQPPTVTALTPTTTENTNPSSSTTHPHHHHNHHQFVDSSTVYHHPFRTITPNSAESNNKILDPQPQSKSSTPTNQHQGDDNNPLSWKNVLGSIKQRTQSRPGSGSTPDWSTAGVGQPQAPQPAPSRRAFSSNIPLDGPASREPQQASSGTGTGYHSPTATPASRRSSSNPNPSPNSNELIPATATPTSTAAPPYYQHQTSQDPSLAMIAAIDCSGLDVRPMYSSEDSRQTPGQGQSQSPHQGHAQNHTRGPSPEEVRAPYYSSLPATHYPPGGPAILPSHYSHAPSPLPLQSGQRRTTSSSTVGSAYGPYHSLSIPAPIGAATYGHHHHHHHPEGHVAPSWTPAVDSVRDTVSPYSRPPRAPVSSSLSGHHQSSSSSYGQSIRNGPLLHSHPSNTSTAHHHQPGTMQYNAQGRPLAYMCNTCLRAFDRPSALQIHERSHTGERPFPCPWNGCVKRFTTHGNMVKHSRVCPFREPEE